MNQIGDFLPAITVNEPARDVALIGKYQKWLEKQTPRTVSNNLSRITKKHGIEFRAGYRSEFPKQGGSRTICTGCRIGGNVKNANAAANELEMLLAPMMADDRSDYDRIEAWLSELHSICARRSDDEIGLRVSLSSYASRLRCYPVDVVRYVLLEKTWKWFPDWHDMKQEADALVSERRMLIDALRKVDPEKTEPVQDSEEVRAAHAEKVMAQFRKATAEAGEPQ